MYRKAVKHVSCLIGVAPAESRRSYEVRIEFVTVKKSQTRYADLTKPFTKTIDVVGKNGVTVTMKSSVYNTKKQISRYFNTRRGFGAYFISGSVYRIENHFA